MNLPDTKTALLLDDLEIALDWMKSLDVTVEPGRLGAYRTIAQKWDECAAGRGKLSLAQLAPILATFAYEVPALISVYRAFHALPRPELAGLTPQLSDVVGVPIRIDDDRSAAPNPARELLFKLLTGAYLHQMESAPQAAPGAASHSSFIHARRHMYVECKRLGEAGSVEAGVKEAAGYLVDTFNLRAGAGNRGLIALDASKCMEPASHVLHAQQRADMPADMPADLEADIEAAADGLLLAFIDTHAPTIQDALRSVDRRIIGVMLFVSTVGVADGGRTLVPMGRWSTLQRQHINISDLEFLAQFPRLSLGA